MVRTLTTLAGLFAAVTTAAQAPEAACARLGAEAVGAGVERLEEAFALPGRPEVFVHDYAEATCVVFLAVSRPSQDLDLQVLGSSGLELGRDDASRPWAWAAHCGAAGQRIAVSVSTRVRGRFALAVLRGAPPERPDLGRRVGGCFAGERGRSADRDARGGGEPSDDELGEMAGRLVVERGEPELRHGRLREGRATVAVGVEAGRCYSVAARSDEPGLHIEGDLAGVRWRTPPNRRAILEACPEVDGELEIWLDGLGDARFVVAIASAEPAPRPDGLVARLHLEAGESIRLEHRPGAPCVTLRAEPVGEEPIDLRLRVLGGPSDTQPAPKAEVHVCAPGSVQLEVQAARGGGSVVVSETLP